MQLAINYSPAAVDLLKTGQITINRFKCPDWDWMITEAGAHLPVAVHFDLAAGNGKARQIDWAHIQRCLENTNTPYLNLHLECKIKDLPDLPVDTRDPHHAQLVYGLMMRDIEEVSKHMPADRVILENVPYRSLDGKILRPSVEPEMITRILSTSGCGLLFDLPHARISAHYLGIPEKEYIEQLPMQRMRELHFTGMEWINGILTDHLGAQEEDWQALDWLSARITSGKYPEPWLLAFEYGGVGDKFEWRSDPQVIASQLPRLAVY